MTALPQVFEGTLDEFISRKEEFAGLRLKFFGLPEGEDLYALLPNEKGLAAMREIRARQKDRPFSDDSDTMRLLREARSGAMYGEEYSDD